MAGLLYFATATLSLGLTQGADGIATMWPPSGLLLATLLLVQPMRRPAYLLAAGLASIAANLVGGTSMPLALGFTLANITEAMVVVAVLRRDGGTRVSFINPAGIVKFGKAVLGGALASATIATMVVVTMPGVSPIRFFTSWFSTVLLGMLLVGSMILLSVETLRAHRRASAKTRPVDALVIMTFVVVIALVTFLQSTLPLLFLPMIAIVVAVFRHGTIGAVAGILVTGVIASVALMTRHGPPTLIPGGRDGQVLFLQFYLLALFASALPTAALLAARDRLRVELAEKLRLLSLAERAARIGHWRVDTARRAIFWSPEVFRIHGVPLGDPPSYDLAIDAYHPDDRARVGAVVAQSLLDGRAFEFRARIVRPDGTICHVVSRGERDYSSDDNAIGLFGLIQDVTVQMEVEQVLTGARESAERAARAATIMAETDQLTGLANRRKTLHALDLAITTAHADGTTLSVAIFDIDYFKSVNDTHGHAIGDQVLCRVARAAETAVRTTDMVGRFGGEEFVLLLPHATPDAAMAVAERVRAAIEAGGGMPGAPRVTASIGIAHVVDGDSSHELLHRADTALYDAKRDGRNQIRMAA